MNEKKPVELGYVTTTNGMKYAVMADMTWRVERGGKVLPSVAEILESMYETFNDFPAAPGNLRLANLAKITGGKVTWHDVYKTATGTVV